MHDTTAKRSTTLAEEFRRIRRQTDLLLEPLGPEDCVAQSMPDASPVKWHLAHTTWFFETFVLDRFASGYRTFHPSFRYLFNSYYEAVGERHPRPERGLLTRPTLEEIHAYRQHVEEALLGLLARNDDGDLAALVDLGLHHLQQHQELIVTDVKHLFSRNTLKPAFTRWGSAEPSAAAPARWMDFPGGIREIGHDGSSFHFDNETPRHRVHLEPFSLASRPVMIGDFLAFIDDGGYRRPELWLSDGWDTVRREGWSAPLYWERSDGDWRIFTAAGMAPLDSREPVSHVSYYEADAYARWAAARLPTEVEWEAAAEREPVEGNFLESGRLHPAPASSGFGQLFGDVWEWTASAYLPYPGFKPAAGAVGEYNGKFMVNQMVLRGGSCATPRSHIRKSYRNFFPPSARWQFTGLRLARS